MTGLDPEHGWAFIYVCEKQTGDAILECVQTLYKVHIAGKLGRPCLVLKSWPDPEYRNSVNGMWSVEIETR